MVIKNIIQGDPLSANTQDAEKASEAKTIKQVALWKMTSIVSVGFWKKQLARHIIKMLYVAKLYPNYSNLNRFLRIG